jgi:uncharacterized membrane protein
MIDPTLADTLLRFAGRLHPALVHFPIALLIVAALLEVVRLVRRRPEPSPTALTCVIIGAVTGVVVAFSGWMNADYESHAESLADELFWHRWLGVTVAALGVVLAGIGLGAKAIKAPSFQRVYALLLLATAALVGLTGHFGGSMVYGPGYLLDAFQSPENPNDDAEIASLPVRMAPADAVLTVDFARDVQPILNTRCIECHGRAKKKAGLRLDHPGFMFELEDVSTVVPQMPHQSDIIDRIERKKGEEGCMPPSGPRLAPREIELIREWIAEGAYWTLAAAAPDPVKPPADAPKEAAPAPPTPAKTWTGDDVAAIESIRAAGGRVEPIAAGSADLDINLSLAGANLSDDHLKPLQQLGPRVKSLNLARTPISDAGIAVLSACTNIETLHLEGTKVTDASMEAIAKLPRLAYLNLNGTAVTDAGVARIAACKSLKNLYVADTTVTLEAAIKLQDASPGLNIELGIPKPK